jgi:phospholipid transport system substrate-binding protein
MPNNLFLVLLLGLLLLTTATALRAAEPQVGAARTVPAAQPAVTEAAESPSGVVRLTIEELLQRLESEGDALKNSPAKLNALVKKVVVPHLDTSRMARIVLGKHVRRAKPDEVQRFTKAFLEILVRTYAVSLSEFGGQEIHFYPEEIRPDHRVAVVKIEIRPASGPSIPLGFSMLRKGNTWRVYDLKIEGISLVTNYRSQFSGIIKNQGLEALIEQLEAKNRETTVASR